MMMMIVPVIGDGEWEECAFRLSNETDPKGTKVRLKWCKISPPRLGVRLSPTTEIQAASIKQP